MAELQKKIYELSPDDLVKLKTIREVEECASDVAALRICIREVYKSRTSGIALCLKNSDIRVEQKRTGLKA